MNRQKFDYQTLGMLAGILLGGGLGFALFASTGYILFITLAGAGAALGIILGAGFDLHARSS
jgi:hypothetical protein